MPRRTTPSHSADTISGLAPPVTPAAGRGARQANTAGTQRYAERAWEGLDDFRRPFPRKLTVSALGIGSYLGDCTDEEDQRYRSSVREALTSGVNVVDTASNYRCQRSERAVGQAVVEAIAAGDVRRDEILVCTKGGYVSLDGAPPASREEYEQWMEKELFAPGIVGRDEVVRGGHSLAPSFLAHQLAQSRTNLGLATIDVYYLHNPEEQLLALDRSTFLERMRAAFALLEERANAGEIVGYGCATWLGLRVAPEHRQHLTLGELVGIAREVGGTAHHFRAVQLPISLAMPEAARVATQPLGGKLVSLLEAADALGLGVVASAPLMQGRLAGGLPPEVHELFPGCTTDAQRALRFAASLPGVATVLAGMRSASHVHENIGAWKAAQGDQSR
jgi:aryl-alcohol dehydrogenase-like predicted oxidoreductase